MVNVTWYYFGCGPDNRPGHYLFRENGTSVYRPPGLSDRLERSFDGSLAPHREGGSPLYVASVSRLGGHGLSALAWWDQSADKRSGSNSVIFAPGLDMSPVTMLSEAERRFPWVFKRLPKPVTLI